VLANLALDGLEHRLKEHFPKPRGAGYNAQVNMVRYADDFIVTGRSKEVLEQEVQPLIEQFMRERGLELSKEKTRITHIESGFDFLGQNVRKYNGKILIKPAKANIHSFLEKVRGVIKANKQATAGHLIGLLNPIIRGWAHYHQHVVSKQTFSSIDHAIFQALVQWINRRHPTKSSQWKKAKYFQTIGGQHWVFHGERNGKNCLLFSAARVPIKRHVKVKGEANPYDPEWERYFERRLDVKMVDNLKGRRQLLYLWKEQNGICPVCKEKITEITGWENHHRSWRSWGGPDSADNRVLLHPNCHRLVHSQKGNVEKPRPARGEREA
jgi:RNA-directed DNA polymerase